MSIDGEIKRLSRARVRSRELTVLPRLYLSDRRVRCMLLSEEVASAVISDSGLMPDDERLGQFRGDLDAFAVGERITIACDPYVKRSDADLAPLHPKESRVWDFRILEPPKGIRCQGFFVAKDMFVALAWSYREDINSSDWQDIIEDCRDRWNRLFYPFAPLMGDCPDAYISKPFLVV